MSPFVYEGRLEFRDAEPGVRSEVALLLDHPDSERYNPEELVEQIEKWAGVRMGLAPGRYRIVVERLPAEDS